MKTIIELSSGEKISISARFVGFDTPEWDKNEYPHPHFRISVRCDRTAIHPLLVPRSHSFDYWGSYMDAKNDKEELTKRELAECLCCLFADGSAYDANREFVDFCAAFGYEKMSDYPYAMDAFSGCRKAHKACEKLFGRLYGSVHNALEEYIENMED